MAGDIGPSRGVGRQVAAETAGVVIVGGGPAGAVLAARLASAGVEVVVLERSPSWRWRAGGVFASPAAVVALRGAGLAGAVLATVARPIPAMRVETASGATFRLTYGADAGGEPAVGFDRSRLDPALLDLAVAAGADVRRGWTATASDPGAGRLVARRPDGGVSVIRSPVIVGADGLRSVVARDAGVARPARLDPRVGLTYHLPEFPDRRRHATRGCGCCMTAMSASLPSRADGSISASCWVGRGVRRSPGTARRPSPTRSWRRSRRLPTTRPHGGPRRRPTRSPAPGRSGIG